MFVTIAWSKYHVNTVVERHPTRSDAQLHATRLLQLGYDRVEVRRFAADAETGKE